MSREDESLDDSSAPLIEHLTELRTCLIRAALAFIVGLFACFFVAEYILNFLAEPIAEILRRRGEVAQLIFTAPQEKFFVLIRISVIFGLGGKAQTSPDSGSRRCIEPTGGPVDVWPCCQVPMAPREHRSAAGNRR